LNQGTLPYHSCQESIKPGGDSLKKKIAIIMAILVLTVALAVPMMVSAATSTTAKGPAALLTYCKELVQKLVTDKKLAQADADGVIAALTAKEAAIAADRPAKGARPESLSRLTTSELAAVIGITEADLQTKMTAGSTIWKIAADAGKLDALKTALIKKVTDQLAAQVTAGSLTAEQSKVKLADYTAKIQAITADSDAHALAFMGLGERGGKGGHRGPGGRSAAGTGTDTQAGATTKASTSSTSAPAA
jgi:hypothetical protein